MLIWGVARDFLKVIDNLEENEQCFSNKHYFRQSSIVNTPFTDEPKSY